MRQVRDNRVLSLRRLFASVAISLVLATAAWAAAPAPLTTLRAIHALTNAEASQKLPVAFEATVNYYRNSGALLFVQDEDSAIYVLDTLNTPLLPGDRVLVKGYTEVSFNPIIVSDSVTLLRHGARPTAISASFADLIDGKRDCMMVTVHAVIQSADLMTDDKVEITYLQMTTDGGYLDATVDSDDARPLSGLLDAEVEITGVAGGKFDGKMQQTGILLHVARLADVKILKRAGASPQSIAVTPMDAILKGFRVQDQTQRVRVHGTITYYQPGSAVVLQDGAKSLWITTLSRNPLQIGDAADATGFPEAHNGILTLTHGEIEDSGLQAPIKPLPANWHQLAFWSSYKPDGHLYDLVSIEGQVVTEVREAVQDEYVLVADGRLFSAIYRHPDPASHIQLSPMLQIPLGSKVRVTGICMNEETTTHNQSEELPFNLLLRSFDDIAVVAKPSLLNIDNLMRIASLLLLVVIVVGVWGTFLNIKVRRQTAAMAKRIEAEAAFERRIAQLEHKRSRILEDINGSRPLAEILEEIMELVSFALSDAPCWCEVTNGARLGDFQPLAEGLRVVRAVIPARSGPPLGALFAALDSEALPATPEAFVHENEALSVGAKLAALAIETRRLYSDLLHRSEFDQLTDIHNRFSLGKRLDEQIEEARANAGIFGLVYVDLDGFKQINDIYGHHIGDLCLQEVARRMKLQLRSHDLLARLGGDEFAVLLPKVPNRAGVEEIVQRLEYTLNEPLILEAHLLQCSASFGIALYPEDGATEDSLLSAADTAMYAVKNSRKQAANLVFGLEETPPKGEIRG
jgi:diguanylate cyclase (GGDEF)-like protein